MQNKDETPKGLVMSMLGIYFKNEISNKKMPSDGGEIVIALPNGKNAKIWAEEIKKEVR